MQSNPFTWRFAWDYPAFRIKFLIGVLVMGLITFYLQDFFLYIQSRSGIQMDDIVLRNLPAHDVSLYIFFILYSFTGFLIWQITRNSSTCIIALWGYIFLCLIRMITIAMIPLDAPKDLIHLSDPFSIVFYGSNLITKDLFFSGHTATLFLVGLCMERKREKYIVFSATIVLGVLLLVQHVHYTADVLAAPVFSYLCWYLGKTIAKI